MIFSYVVCMIVSSYHIYFYTVFHNTDYFKADSQLVVL